MKPVLIANMLLLCVSNMVSLNAHSENQYHGIETVKNTDISLYINKSFDPACNTSMSSNSKYTLSIEISDSRPEITLKKSLPSYTTTQLTSIDGPGITNAYDTIKFNIDNNGNTTITNIQDIYNNYKNERSEIYNAINLNETLASRAMAFKIAESIFPSRIEKDIKIKFGEIFDAITHNFNYFEQSGSVSPYKLNHLLNESLTYEGRYSFENAQPHLLNIAIRSTQIKQSEGDCSKDELVKLKETSEFNLGSLRLASCPKQEDFVITYKFNDSKQLIETATSINRIAHDGSVFDSCSNIKIIR